MKAGSDPKVVYLHQDNLDSTRLVTDGSGILQELDYDAFGNPRKADWSGMTPLPNTTGVNALFTGQESDPEHGLINMQGRIYDPRARQFLTPDPFVQAPWSSVGLNRYAYVFDNPLAWTDPSGFQASGEGSDSDAGAAGDDPVDMVVIGRRLRDDPRSELKPGNLLPDAHSANPANPQIDAGAIGNGDSSAPPVKPRNCYPFTCEAAERAADVHEGVQAYGYFLQFLIESWMGGEVLEIVEELNLARQASNVWKLDKFKRGIEIEQQLGRNLPEKFPVIDRFSKGVATSIKSIDVHLKTYQTLSKLRYRIFRDIRDLKNFQGAKFMGFVVKKADIAARQFELGIPSGASAAQQQVLQQAVAYGKSLGIVVKIVWF